MTAPREAEILALGMITPVGSSVRKTAAAVRAGISRFRESPYLDQRGEPVYLSAVPEEDLPPLAASLQDLPAMSERRAQVLRLAAVALEEALSSELDSPRIPVLLALPEALPGLSTEALEPGFLRQLAVQSRVRFDLERSRAFAGGRASGIALLSEALERLDLRTTPHILVGGADSHQDAALLSFLDDEDRLRAAGVHDGFTPGEGAAFVLLGAPGSARRRHEEPLARLTAAAFAEEPGHRYSKEPYRGEGLDKAFQGLFARAPGPVQTVYAGLNGESFSAKEWGVALLRSKTSFAEGFQLFYPAEQLGDTGAASGPLLVGLAAMGMHGGYRRAPCLVWSSSDLGGRGAALVSPAIASGQRPATS